jgi:hypothetical protein
VSWIARAVALVLAGLGAVIFYNEPVPISASAWIVSGGLWAVAAMAWLLGHGIHFVLAGPPPKR